MSKDFRTILTLVLCTIVYQSYADSLNDSMFQLKAKQLRRHIHLYQQYDCNNVDEDELNFYYLDKLSNDLQTILKMEESIQFKFSQFKMLNVSYIQQNKFKLISFNDNPCGIEQSNTLLIQWRNSDSSIGVLKTEDFGVKDLYALNDSLFVFTCGVNDGPGFFKSIELWKFANDTFSVVRNPWSEYYYQKHFECEGIEINSYSITMDNTCYGGYNAETKTIEFEACESEDEEPGFYYQFYQNRFILRRKKLD